MAKGKRNLFPLICTECKRINYYSKKNVTNTTDKVELKKYCPFERKVTVHKETKLPPHKK